MTTMLLAGKPHSNKFPGGVTPWQYGAIETAGPNRWAWELYGGSAEDWREVYEDYNAAAHQVAIERAKNQK